MCPECGRPMIVYEWAGVEVDHCLACGGTWLDAGELESIGARAGAQPGRLAQALREARDGVAGRRRCPRCRKRLRRILVGAARPVELDRCPRGHGLWFDRGEIQALIARFEEGEEGAVARFFANLYHHQQQTNEKGS